MPNETSALDYPSISLRQQDMWSTGDFSVIAMSIVPASEALVLAVDPHAGQRVLDVACGSGNTALVAARRYCSVTGLDYVPALLERAKRRAAAEGVSLELCEGDAQAMPFTNASFDVVLSTFGVMFAPRQDAAARELLRVCRPGGKLGLASWVPDGAIGRFFRLVSSYAPPPAGLTSPMRWGTSEGITELLGAGVSKLDTTRRTVTEHFRSPEHALEVFRGDFGPVRSAFAALPSEGQQSFAAELVAFFRDNSRSGDATVALPLEYLEVVATVR